MEIKHEGIDINQYTRGRLYRTGREMIQSIALNHTKLFSFILHFVDTNLAQIGMSLFLSFYSCLFVFYSFMFVFLFQNKHRQTCVVFI